MFNVHPSRQQMYADDPKFLWKYILRTLAIILAIISIGLLGWSLANQIVPPNNNYTDYDLPFYNWPYDNNIWFLPWSFITLGLSVIWNVVNILILLTRNRPIHPGANVACDLLLWLGLIITGALATTTASTDSWWYPDYNSYDNNNNSYFTSPNGTVTTTTDNNPTSPTCDASCLSNQQSYTNALTRTGIIISVGAALSFLVLLFHFALFISACRYTNARRVNAKAAIIAEKMYGEKVHRREEEEGGVRMGMANPNEGFVPISEPLEQQAPLDYGMPPAPTGMTVGEQGRRMRGVVGDGQEREGVTRRSCEQPEVVVSGESAAAGGRGYGNDVYEA